jgi:D-cysteine desulfhydrase
LLGLAGGGNKTRKLEFLVAEALGQGADTLITCGAVQSNHCRLTLAAAVKEGLKCRLVLEERVPGSYKPESGGNNFLFQLMGVEKINVAPGGSDMMAKMQSVADEVAAEGRKAYVIPGGGSNPVGATPAAAPVPMRGWSPVFTATTAISRLSASMSADRKAIRKSWCMISCKELPNISA